MNTYMRALAALILLSLSGHAAANPELKRVTPTFHQSNATLSAGLLVEASTDLPVLIIGGGFTITCNTSSLQYTAEGRATFTGFMGISKTLLVPEVVPSTYVIPGWSSLPAGSCDAQCVMQYKGETRDETSLSIRVGNAGIGANFTLIPAGEQWRGDTTLIDVCKRQRQCCTPLCAIP